VNRSDGLRRRWRLARVRKWRRFRVRQWRLERIRQWRLDRIRQYVTQWKLAARIHVRFLGHGQPEAVILRLVGHYPPPGCSRVAAREPRQKVLGPLHPLNCDIASRDGEI
jgi:hypothetical protein